MGKVSTYNPKEVTCALGTHIAGGFAEDSFIAIDPSGDGVTKKVGCDGEVVRTVSPDDTYVIKLSLLQTSATNAFLEEQLKKDRKNGNGMFAVLIKDLKGGLVFSADAAWAIRSASRTFGKEAGNREWEIHTGSGTLKE